MEIRFHLDEHVDPGVALGLRLRGVDVTTSADKTLLGTEDAEQLAFARRENRVLVTQNEDFLAMPTSGLPHAGIAYSHQQGKSIGEFIRGLMLIHQCLTAEEMTNQVEFL